MYKRQIEKSGDSEVNKLFSEAVIASSTDEVPAKVEVDKYAIGYTSIGAVNDSIKAVKVDGVEATEENVKNGTYKVSRPFIIASKGEASGDVYKRQIYTLKGDLGRPRRAMEIIRSLLEKHWEG